MDMTLFATQVLNGIQFGMGLFLLAAGLTLVFGILHFINLAHGAFYMLGAFITGAVSLATGSFLLGLLTGAVMTGLIGLLVEGTIIRRLYRRDHLEQVLATFGLLLCADTAVHFVHGPEALSVPLPAWLQGHLDLGFAELPVYRAFIVAFAALIALVLWLVVAKTKAGMLMRAAASNRVMAEMLGIESTYVFAGIFATGALLAGLAGGLIAPITGATIGMGGPVVILAFVVIIIGGIGSMRGAFVAALLVGLIDTLGRSYLDEIMARVFSPQIAETAGPALASVLIYIMMVAILAFRPEGLFPAASRSS